MKSTQDKEINELYKKIDIIEDNLAELKVQIKSKLNKKVSRFEMGDVVWYHGIYENTKFKISDARALKRYTLDPTCHKTKEELDEYWGNLEIQDKVLTRLKELNDGLELDWGNSIVQYYTFTLHFHRLTIFPFISKGKKDKFYSQSEEILNILKNEFTEKELIIAFELKD